MECKNSLTESPESSPSPPSPSPNSSPRGAVKQLVGLPSRGLFSSTILSSNLGEMRVYVCDHNTAPPEEQVIKTNGMNILIKALQINKEKIYLMERGLSIKGKKDELIARMKNKDKDA
ncbi:DET1- and DDB1-associated protein 1 N-terminal [Dioscorea alata]|uniref:DET1- and DDB1-associated protein 1 N-terminal n=1 Tax=Dioscorea alata TaxID=55571 RepID=A0ACB7V1D0_DIOAL|nr:DET1- and DDB1-associated protein 1 N-terminal [Dioscorea alata]